jgi:hypothetical protein
VGAALFALVPHVSPAQAAKAMIGVTIAGVGGRFVVS